MLGGPGAGKGTQCERCGFLFARVLPPSNRGGDEQVALIAKHHRSEVEADYRKAKSAGNKECDTSTMQRINALLRSAQVVRRSPRIGVSLECH